MAEEVGAGAAPVAGEPIGPVLGIDPGDARVGLAISDPDGTVAVPIDPVPAEGAVEAIAELAAERSIARVVVGHPVSMSGHAGPRAKAAEAFAARLAARLGQLPDAVGVPVSAPVPVELQDERLSTAEADRALRDAGASAGARKGARDSSAAAVILQAWLDAHRRR